MIVIHREMIFLRLHNSFFVVTTFHLVRIRPFYRKKWLCFSSFIHKKAYNTIILGNHMHFLVLNDRYNHQTNLEIMKKGGQNINSQVISENVT